MWAHFFHSLISITSYLAIWAALPAHCDHSSDDGHGKKSVALLVGVSHYPNLAERHQLKGPGNDVNLMRELLVRKFSFSPEAIRTLSEEAGQRDASLLPTRENIEREFLRLAAAAQSGDGVVVFMTGHGSQQPEQKGGEPEIDGLDEIFLPRDVQQWQGDAEGGHLPNAIVDNEIAQWLQAIQAKKARLWVIFDCCHSGDMTRGFGEQERFVVPNDKEGLAIPVAAIEAARRQSLQRDAARERTRGDVRPDAAMDLANQQNGLAVFYACQSHEKAIERPFTSTDQGKHYGLLTYSLNSVLSKAKGPLSYRELSRQIHLEYIAAGRSSNPTPLVEGADIDRAVLGTETIARPQITVAYDAGSRILSIDAGRLHGITPNSVLAVLPPPGQEAEKQGDKTVRGYVQVADVDIASAIVNTYEFQGLPRKTPKTLAGGRCEVVELDYGDLRVAVHVDPQDNQGGGIPVSARLQAIMRELASEKNSLVTQASSPAAAQWFIRWQNDEILLVPAQQWARRVNPATSDYLPHPPTMEKNDALGPFKLDERLPEALRSTLRRIARAENLLRLAANMDGRPLVPTNSPPVGIKVDATIERSGNTRPADGVAQVQPGDVIAFRVTNIGQKPVDLTVLYLNSRMGITALFPLNNETNRVRPNETQPWAEASFNDGPFGRSHLIFLAVHSQGQPVDFTSLAQLTVGKYRDRGSPLDALLKNALFGEGGTRNGSAEQVRSYCFELVPFDVIRRSE